MGILKNSFYLFLFLNERYRFLKFMIMLVIMLTLSFFVMGEAYCEEPKCTCQGPLSPHLGWRREGKNCQVHGFLFVEWDEDYLKPRVSLWDRSKYGDKDYLGEKFLLRDRRWLLRWCGLLPHRPPYVLTGSGREFAVLLAAFGIVAPFSPFIFFGAFLVECGIYYVIYSIINCKAWAMVLVLGMLVGASIWVTLAW